MYPEDLTSTMQALRMRLDAILDGNNDQPVSEGVLDTGGDQPQEPADDQPTSQKPAATAPKEPAAPAVPPVTPDEVGSDIKSVMVPTIVSIATDLGIENADDFKTAFNVLRKQGLPSNPDQQAQLADAFCKIMSGEPKVVAAALTGLRSIYRKSQPNV